MIKFLTLGIILLLNIFSIFAQDDGISCYLCPPEEIIISENIHELRYSGSGGFSTLDLETSENPNKDQFRIVYIYSPNPYAPENDDSPSLFRHRGLNADYYYFDFTAMSGRDFTAITFSPDPRKIAAGNQNGQISLWDFPRSALLQTIEGLNSPIIDLLFHPGGDFIIALHEPNIIQIYFLDTEASYRLETPDLSQISSIALNSSGSLLAASGEETIHLWDMNDFSSLAVEKTDAPIYKLIFHPTQANEFVSIHSNTILNWSWQDNRLESSTFVERLPHHILESAEGAFNVDASVLAIIYDHQRVGLWDAITGDLLDVPAVQRMINTQPPINIEDLLFSQDGKWLIIGGERGLQLFSIPHMEKFTQWPCIDCPPQEPITSETIYLSNHVGMSISQPTFNVVFSQDSQLLFAIGERTVYSSIPYLTQRGVFSWYLSEAGEDFKRWWETDDLDFNDHLTHLASSSLSNKIATGEDTGVIKIWDVDKNRLEDVIVVRSAPVTDLKFHPKNDLLVSVHEYRQIGYDLSDYERYWLKLPFEPDYISNISFNADGSLMVSGADESVMLWDAEAWDNLGVFEVATNRVDQVSFYPNQTDQLIMISGSEVSSWQLADGDLNKIIQFEKPTTENGQFVLKSQALSPDGSLLIAIYNQHDIIVWDTYSGEILDVPQFPFYLSQYYIKDIYSVAFSPDGLWLIFGDSTSGINFYNIPKLGFGYNR